MTVGDQCWIELVNTNDRHSNSITNLKNRVIVWDETFHAVTLDTNDVWQPVDEVFFHVTERTTNDVCSGFTDVKLQDKRIVFKTDHLFNLGRPQTGIQTTNGTSKRIDDMVDVRPLLKMALLVLLNITCVPESANACQAVLPILFCIGMFGDRTGDEVRFVRWCCCDKHTGVQDARLEEGLSGGDVPVDHQTIQCLCI